MVSGVGVRAPSLRTADETILLTFLLRDTAGEDAEELIIVATVSLVQESVRDDKKPISGAVENRARVA